ncbi:TlpA disulfide reductase family protein [Winogradskyella maritima]|uniref:TlpA family protein disulfide reductase n=1 Tax=Winogradskyella maritima TaxID=1517766 RepID=A0ABV8AKC2_9FLAO|nr:TlpA disulfide reductase family protein [Winogradskyella maritima]
MIVNTLKSVLLVLMVMGFTHNAVGQINVSEFMQASKIASADDNKLYYVDFWATWCGPCIHAKKYLSSIQRQVPNDFYIISLSEENPVTVERFLEKRPSDLAVAIDNYGETFKKYKVRALPNGMLFNANGKKLWEGSPGDLTVNLINRYLRQERTRSSLNEFVNIIEEVASEDISDYIPTKDLEIKPIPAGAFDLQVEDANNYLKVKGDLKAIVGYLAKIYKNQIDIDAKANTNYEVIFKKPLNPSENLALKFIKELGYGVERSMKKGEVLTLDLKEPRFWDINQINWGAQSGKFLVGDSEIEADNATLKAMAYQLAFVLDVPVIINNEDERSFQNHDWRIHYKFFELMKADLSDSFGIEVEKKMGDYPVYRITKKAP